MKAYYYDQNGVVVDIVNLHESASIDRCILAEDVPDGVFKEGFIMRLVAKNGVLCWEYIQQDIEKRVALAAKHENLMGVNENVCNQNGER